MRVACRPLTGPAPSPLSLHVALPILAMAERGLELTSLDGTIRRPLIEVAGVAACRLGRTAKLRHYLELAAPGHERAGSGEHTSELQALRQPVCRPLHGKKKRRVQRQE